MKIAKRWGAQYQKTLSALAFCCLVQACDGLSLIVPKDDASNLSEQTPQVEAVSKLAETTSRQPDASELLNATMVEAANFVLEPVPVFVGYRRSFLHTFRLPEGTPAPCFLGYQLVTWGNQLGKGAVRWTLLDEASDEELATHLAQLSGMQDWYTLWFETPPLSGDISYRVRIETVEDADFMYGFAAGQSSNMSESQLRIEGGTGDLDNRDFGFSYWMIPC